MTWRLVAFLTLLSPVLHGAPTVTFTSGAGRVALIELFTSEGCSSCPPAEHWLAERRTDAGLWRDFVPVAWHITYWDHLGWADRLAQRAFTDRQSAYAAAWHSDSVYTPCFVRDGAEWRPGRIAGPGPAAGVLQVRYDPRTGVLRATYRPTRADGEKFLEVHAAQLGGGVVSQVRAGENAGHRLEHEFAVLALGHGRLASDPDGFDGTLTLPLPATAGVPRHALAVWVTRPGELAPLQATGG